eukprot:1158256-Pelagomonas_calceolata.AAC.7
MKITFQGAPLLVLLLAVCLQIMQRALRRAAQQGGWMQCAWAGTAVMVGCRMPGEPQELTINGCEWLQTAVMVGCRMPGEPQELNVNGCEWVRTAVKL